MSERSSEVARLTQSVIGELDEDGVVNIAPISMCIVPENDICKFQVSSDDVVVNVEAFFGNLRFERDDASLILNSMKQSIMFLADQLGVNL